MQQLRIEEFLRVKFYIQYTQGKTRADTGTHVSRGIRGKRWYYGIPYPTEGYGHVVPVGHVIERVPYTWTR